MLTQHCLQLVPDPQAEGEQGCPLCATLAGQSWPLLTPATTSVFQVRSRKRNRR